MQKCWKNKYLSSYSCGRFFPERATFHTKNVTKQNFGNPEFWGTKIAVQRPSDRFRNGCPHSTDSELRHVNQFHHVILQLCPKIGPLISRCFLKVNKIGLADSFLSSIATLFRVRLSASYFAVARTSLLCACQNWGKARCVFRVSSG